MTIGCLQVMTLTMAAVLAMTPSFQSPVPDGLLAVGCCWNSQNNHASEGTRSTAPTTTMMMSMARRVAPPAAASSMLSVGTSSSGNWATAHAPQHGGHGQRRGDPHQLVSAADEQPQRGEPGHRGQGHHG